VTERIDAPLRTPKGDFTVVGFAEKSTGDERPSVALVHGDISRGPVAVRMQSECLTGHVFDSLTCDCSGQKNDSLDIIVERGAGVLIHLWQEGRGIGLADKMRAYSRQMAGFDTVDANIEIGRGVDEREYSDAARLLGLLGVSEIDLITNNPAKIDDLTNRGIVVRNVIPLPPHVNDLNRRYLATKVARLGHMYDVEAL